MYEDGLYISHGPKNSALVVIREDGGNTLWIRNFATVDYVTFRDKWRGFFGAICR
jgi:hypothetical protein